MKTSYHSSFLAVEEWAATKQGHQELHNNAPRRGGVSTEALVLHVRFFAATPGDTYS